MDDNADSYELPTSKLDAELRRLNAMNIARSAELVIEASWATESSEKTEDAESDQAAMAAGAFIGGRNALANASEIGALVDELRRTFAEPMKTDEAKGRLLQLWTITEPWLLESEIDELRSAILAKLFGERETAISLSRGGQSQGGGY
jgi:hypothetical protein